MTRVFLETYNAAEGKIPGPTLRLRPGDTLQLRLLNQLPPEAEGEPMDINMPHHFNVTNIHTHGFHVSPRCSADGTVCSDNVLIELEPGQSQFYEYTLPQDRPDGTYWYHPHRHGSAAIQVMGGMAGASIIEGDTDDFLRDHGVQQDRVFVLQPIRVNLDGEAEFMNDASFSTPPLFAVNGELQPTMQIRPGEIQRWRFINAGEHEHLPLELRAEAGNAPQTLHQLAFDGMTLPNLEDAQRRYGHDAAGRDCQVNDILLIWEGRTMVRESCALASRRLSVIRTATIDSCQPQPGSMLCRVDIRQQMPARSAV